MPIFKEVANQIGTQKEHILIVPKNFQNINLNDLYGDISMFEISFDTHKTLYESEFAFICSGTATLEAALIGTPFVLAYKAKAFDFFIGTKIFDITTIGLANIFFEKMGKSHLHKEILQEDVTTDNLIEQYWHLNKDKFIQQTTVLREYLHSGSSQKVANLIENK